MHMRTFVQFISHNYLKWQLHPFLVMATFMVQLKMLELNARWEQIYSHPQEPTSNVDATISFTS